MTNDRNSENARTVVEELEVSSQELIEQVRALVRRGNTRRVTLYTQGNEELLSLPLTLGVVAGGLVTLSAPVLAGLGAVAALVSHVRLVVTLDGPRPGQLEGTAPKDAAQKDSSAPPHGPL
jgi:Domain of unknown function (DUF4342)